MRKYRDAKRGWGERVSLQIVMQGYLVVAVTSTSGWDVLLMVTLLLLGIVTLREVVGASRHCFSKVFDSRPSTLLFHPSLAPSYFTTTKTSRGSAKSRAEGVMMVRGPT